MQPRFRLSSEAMRRLLRVGEVHFGNGILASCILSNVAHDSDDLVRLFLTAQIDSQVLSDRVFAWKEPPRE